MSWGATAAIVGSTLYSSYQAGEAAEAGGEAAISAAQIQAASADRAADIQLQMFQEGQEATAPWRETGEQALGGLADIYGLGGDEGRARAMQSFQASPGYQWQLDEATKASEGAAAAGGRFYGGSQMKALQNLAQNRASLDFGQYTQGLQSLAGVGQTSAGQTAQQSTAVGGNIGQSYMAAGQASAQGVIGAGQAAAAGSINQANILSNLASQGMYGYGMGMFESPATKAPPPSPAPIPVSPYASIA